MKLSEIRDMLLDFYSFYFLVAIVFIIGFLILEFIPNAWTSASFIGSKLNPFGAITSIFVNANFNLYFSELSGYSGPLIFLVLTTITYDRNKRRKATKFLCISSFLIAIIATEIWEFISYPNYTTGPSGLTYAMVGVAIGYALVNLGDALSKSKIHTHEGYVNMVWSGALVLGFIANVILFPTTLFYIYSGIAYLLHEISFLIGFLAGFAYLFLTNKEKRNVSKQKLEEKLQVF